MLAMIRACRFGIGCSAPGPRGPLRGPDIRGLTGSIALTLLLSACAPDHNPSLNLPVACETAICDCAKDNGYTTKPPPMLWKIDGTAYCPEGYHLHMPPPSSQRMTVQ
jgi:hypothetical protein